jgi:hypothetical protein
MFSTFRNATLSAIVAGLGLVAAGSAEAFPITYDFTVTATSGPLNGTVSHGSLSYDSSSITLGNTNAATGLLTALSFSWNAIAYTPTTANTGSLSFDTSGKLTLAFFGTECGPASCSLDAANNANGFTLDAFPGLVGTIAYTVRGNTTTGFGGRVTTALAVPASEPTTFALLGLGCVLVGAARAARVSTRLTCWPAGHAGRGLDGALKPHDAALALRHMALVEHRPLAARPWPPSSARCEPTP